MSWRLSALCLQVTYCKFRKEKKPLLKKLAYQYDRHVFFLRCCWGSCWLPAAVGKFSSHRKNSVLGGLRSVDVDPWNHILITAVILLRFDLLWHLSLHVFSCCCQGSSDWQVMLVGMWYKCILNSLLIQYMNVHLYLTELSVTNCF